MSKGNERLTFRIGGPLKAEMDEAVSRFNQTQTCREPIDISEFIRRAIREKLDHLGRSRKKSSKLCSICDSTGMVRDFGPTVSLVPVVVGSSCKPKGA